MQGLSRPALTLILKPPAPVSFDTLLSYAYLALAVSLGGGAILSVFFRRLGPAEVFWPPGGKLDRMAPSAFPLPAAGIALGRTPSFLAGQWVRLAHEDRRRHLGIIGGQAAEREAFLANLIRQDIHAGYGVCLVTASASLAECALGHVPAGRMSGVVYLDAADAERPLGLSPFDAEPGAVETVAGDEFGAAVREAVARDGALRGILGQERPTFSARAVLNSGNILLVNLAAGRIGAADAALLGRVILGRLLAAARGRAAGPAAAKPGCHVYLDAAAGYAGRTMVSLIGAARRAGITLTVAEPSLAAVDAATRGALLVGLGSLVVLRAGPADVPLLTACFAPTVPPTGLAASSPGRALVRLHIGGEAAPLLAIRPASASPGDPATADRARMLSRMTYGRPRLAVEAEINRRERHRVPS